jgi:hypothetical protein
MRECWTRTEREKAVVKRWGAGRVLYVVEYASHMNRSVDFETGQSKKGRPMQRIIEWSPPASRPVANRNIKKT